MPLGLEPAMEKHSEQRWTSGVHLPQHGKTMGAQPTFMWGLQFASHRSPNTKYSIILSIPSHNCNSFFFFSSVTEQFRAVVMRCTVLDHCYTTHQSVETSFRFVCAVFCAVHAGEARARSLLRNGSQLIKKNHILHFYTFLSICALSLHLQQVKDMWKLENGTLCYVVATLASRLITTKHEGPVAHPLLATVKIASIYFPLKMSPSVTTALF